MATSAARDRYLADPPSIALVKRFVVAVAAAHLLLGIVSSYRAWVQIRSVELLVHTRQLRSGTPLSAEVVSWARTHVRVDLELVQGARAETLGVTVIRSNEQAVYDPRWRRGTLRAVVTSAQLARLQPGPATVRVTARGGSQFLRVPPPIVRTFAVDIGRAPRERP
jgi:hypothetical protein